MLGATPQIGRLFGPQDFEPDFASVDVISDGLCADPNVFWAYRLASILREDTPSRVEIMVEA